MKRLGVPIALVVVAVALVVVATLAILHPRTKGSVDNEALVDRARTTEVIGQVSTALSQVLSYSYSDPSTNAEAAKKWLTRDAVDQYKVLFTQLEKRAGDQQLTFVAKVVTAGVISLAGDTAQLLVFLDQKSTRHSDGQSTVAAAEVLIGAEQHGGTWSITELKPL